MDAERREVLRRVMKAMRHPAARIPLADYNADGGRQTVICLADDTLEYAVSRVLAVGGRATVVIPRDGGLVPLSWDVDASSATLVEVDSPLHPEAQLGLLLDYIEVRDDHQLQFQVALGGVDVREHTPIAVPV